MQFTFGAAVLGVAVGAFQAGNALASVPLGRLVDRVGVTWSMRLALMIAAVASLGIATSTVGWKSLVAWLLLAGTANALGQPAANRMLSNNVRTERLGAAFGVKQSAPPAAGMLAGLSVPLALAAGWRWTYAGAVVFALFVVLTLGHRLPRPPGQARPVRQKLEGPWTIVLFAVAFGLSTLGAAAATGFFVADAVRSGLSQHFAGAMLAVASALAIAVRVLAGLACDRMSRGHLWLCAALLAIGALGLTMLAIGGRAALIAGIVIALAGCWGYNGAFWYALVRAYPGNPGSITGAIAPGSALGGGLGPVVFGLITQHGGFVAAWTFAALSALVSAGIMVVGNRRLPTSPGHADR